MRQQPLLLWAWIVIAGWSAATFVGILVGVLFPPRGSSTTTQTISDADYAQWASENIREDIRPFISVRSAK